MFRNALRTVRDGLLSLSYPEVCRICAGPVDSWDLGVACLRCWEDPSITELLFGQALCAKCGAPLQNTTGMGGSERKADAPGVDPHSRRFCARCRDFPFSAARSCGIYTGALEASILFLKTQPHIPARLRSVLIDTFSIHREALWCDLVIPMPLHRARRKERGFNQAALIARIIASRFDLPLDEHSLVRIKHTERHRAGMDAIDRAKSVEGAFEVSRPRVIRGTSVLLVDDVYTTGSTIRAAATELLKAGAGPVTVITIARVAQA